jgi:ribonuclease P protein component
MLVTAKQTQSARPPASSGAHGTASASASAASRLKPNAFPKSARLLKHPSFQRVYDQGSRQFSASMTFFYVLSEGKGKAEIGLTVGRALGGAVDRNRIKRRMRDCIRHELATLQRGLAEKQISAEIVINPKRTALTTDIAKLRAEVARGFAAIISASKASGTGAQRSR